MGGKFLKWRKPCAGIPADKIQLAASVLVSFSSTALKYLNRLAVGKYPGVFIREAGGNSRFQK
jgi:hypothetical protein